MPVKAVQFSEYGEPDVLRVVDAEEPHAGPGEVRIAVRAAGVNPIDWKIRTGVVAGGEPLGAPLIPGLDAAGVVDEVGDGGTVLINGAAGGVGSAAVQFARARGLRVIGTASERNHDYLRSLGAEPV